MTHPEGMPPGIVLGLGRHADPADGVCVVEYASLLAGGPFTDQPPGVSRVLATFLRLWNDGLDAVRRQSLLPCAPKLATSSADPVVEQARALALAQWLVAEHAPRWLWCAGMDADAARVAAAGGDPDAAIAVLGALLRGWPELERLDLHAATGASVRVREILYTTGAGAAWAACRDWAWRPEGAARDLDDPWLKMAWGGWLASWNALQRALLLPGGPARVAAAAEALHASAHALIERLFFTPPAGSQEKWSKG